MLAGVLLSGRRAGGGAGKPARHTYPLFSITHNEHEAHAPPPVLVHELVQGRQRAPVLVEAVHEAPLLANLEALGQEGAHLLGDAVAQQALVGRGVGVVALEAQGLKAGQDQG